MALCVFDAPLWAGLYGDPEVAAALSPDASLAAMLRIEAAFSRALGAAGRIDPTQAERVAAIIEGFAPDLAALAEDAARDGIWPPGLVRQLKGVVAPADHGALHKGLTSQDLHDTALVLALRDVNALFAARLEAILAALDGLAARFGQAPLMGRTRMQAALPITVGDRIAPWREGAARALARLAALRPELEALQFGGAVGTRCEIAPDGDAVAPHLAAALGLSNPPRCWHTERGRIADYGGWLSTTAGTLGKIGQDVALMAQMGEITADGGGKSSAMAHKQNPVLAETLVSLSRFVAAQLGGLHQAMIHEQDRSGAAWALEWMILPPMIAATGAGLLRAQTMLAAITRMGDPV